MRKVSHFVFLQMLRMLLFFKKFFVWAYCYIIFWCGRCIRNPAPGRMRYVLQNSRKIVTSNFYSTQNKYFLFFDNCNKIAKLLNAELGLRHIFLCITHYAILPTCHMSLHCLSDLFHFSRFICSRFVLCVIVFQTVQHNFLLRHKYISLKTSFNAGTDAQLHTAQPSSTSSGGHTPPSFLRSTSTPPPGP